MHTNQVEDYFKGTKKEMVTNQSNYIVKVKDKDGTDVCSEEFENEREALAFQIQESMKGLVAQVVKRDLLVESL